ncbi:MAG: C25 family cysteine peptidase [Siphonobacter sp.]
MKYTVRISILVGILVASFFSGRAQTFANEWINPSQTYFKFTVPKDGIYRINYQTLQSAGFPLSTNPKNLQLFRRGKEIAITVSGQDDGQWNSEDYIEFYGKQNDGLTDSLLYYPTTAQLHPYYSLFADSASYFVTIRTDGTLGKRMTTYKDETSTLTPETYHFDEQFVSFTGDFAAGQFLPYGRTDWNALFYGQYDYGEGYTNGYSNKGVPYEYQFSILSPVKDSANLATLEAYLVGRSPNSHIVDFTINSDTEVWNTVTFEGYKTAKFSKDLSLESLPTSNLLTITTTSRGTESLDQYAAGYYKIRYKQTLDQFSLDSKLFRLRLNSVKKSSISVVNVPSSSNLYDVTNPINPIRIGFNYSNDTIQAVVRNTDQERTLLISREQNTVSNLHRVQLRSIPTTASYIIISHPQLMKPVGDVADPVHAYAAYRASSAGGKHDTLVVTVDELYDHFNYGDKSTAALRVFADYLVHKGHPEHFFLIGSARWNHVVRLVWDADAPAEDLVPTQSYPGSDVQIIAGLNGQHAYLPAFGIGRLTALTPLQVLNYLNKVKEFEAAPLELWRKKFLNLSGGKTVSELTLFKSYVDGYGEIASNSYIGGEVTTLSKKTDEPVELINVSQQLNNGTAVVTFFGHSGASVTDLDIGMCSNDLLGYSNKGKYPIIIANGCSAGSYYKKGTFGEDWLMTADRGAILFMAHGNAGYSTFLDQYCTILYKVATTDSSFLNKPWGAIHRETIRRYIGNQTTLNDYVIQQLQSFTLQGDPAVVIFPYNKTDYSINNSSIFLQGINGEEVVATVDSFRVGMVVSNLAKVSSNSFKINLKRTLSTGTVVDMGTQTYAPISYQDTLYFTVQNAGMGGGVTKFLITIDPDGEIEEMSKANNQATLNYTIPGSLARPVLPANYAIVGTLTNSQPTARLVAEYTPATSSSSTTPNILFEIDTSATYSSSFKQTTTLAASNTDGWNVSLLDKDSTVYYWRVRGADEAFDDNNQWTEYSFTYIRGVQDGWSQSTANQFASVTSEVIGLSGTKWAYTTNELKINLQVLGAKVSTTAYQQTQLKLEDLIVVTNGNCNKDALVAIAFSKTSLTPYSVLSAQLCGNSPYAANYFSADNISAGLLDQYLTAIPDSDFVLLFPSGSVDISTWSIALKQKVKALGADERLDQLIAGSAFILLARKGTGSALQWLTPAVLAEGDSTTLSLTDYELQDSYTQGTLTSPLIGPTTSWGVVQQKVALTDTQKAQLDIYGVDYGGNETLLFKDITARNLSISSINASNYPYLRLREKVTGNTTPAQLQRWLVTYASVPEGVTRLDGEDTYRSSYSYSINEGESFTGNLNYVLLSKTTFIRPVIVRVKVSNSNTNVQSTSEYSVPSTMNIPLTVSYSNLSAGENRITVNVNPEIQPEVTYTNNSVTFIVTVAADETAPTLEVTFDGKTIQDGDYVSPNPTIQIRLLDENLYQIRKDTTGIDVYLQQPDADLVRIPFKNISWEVQENNDFRATYSPENLSDGTYLLQVQGRDVAGNMAGGIPYSIHFTVLNQSGVQQMNVSPNPLQYYSRFTVNLSGDQIPDQFAIEIYNLQGKIIRIITNGDKALTIGRNEFYWDGTDQQGISLPAGVYVYRIKMTQNGQAMPVLDSSQSKSLGRIVIAR